MMRPHLVRSSLVVVVTGVWAHEDQHLHTTHDEHHHADAHGHPNHHSAAAVIADFERLFLHGGNEDKRMLRGRSSSPALESQTTPGSYFVNLQFKSWSDDELGTEDWFNDPTLPPQSGRLRKLAEQSSKVHKRRLTEVAQVEGGRARSVPVWSRISLVVSDIELRR